MSIEELKESYINKNENVENETRGWSKSLFGVNTNGDSFWSIGLDYMYELVRLLGNKEVYDKFNIEQLENLLEDEKYIQDLLSTTNDSEYIKLKEILTLNDSVKKMLYDYIKSKLLQIKLETWRNNLEKHAKEGIKYSELNRYSFYTDKDGKYVARNVLFNNLKVNKIEILGDINTGLNTLQNIIEKYKDTDLKKLCVDMLMVDDISEWDDEATSYEGCYNLLSDEIDNIDIYDADMEIWFGTKNLAFEGHTPVLHLSADEKKNSIGLQG